MYRLDASTFGNLCILDFEASSLHPTHSFPVQVGVTSITSSPKWECEYVIRPAREWVNDVEEVDLAWSTQSEDMHGFKLDELLREGASESPSCGTVIETPLTPSEIMMRMNRQYAGKRLYCDAIFDPNSPNANDYHWWDRFCQASEGEPEFEVCGLQALLECITQELDGDPQRQAMLAEWVSAYMRDEVPGLSGDNEAHKAYSHKALLDAQLFARHVRALLIDLSLMR